MAVCEVCHNEVEATHTQMGVETCRECRIRQVEEAVERQKKPFPACAKGCEMLALLGASECESVCPHRFDEDGNPLEEVIL